MKNRILEIMLPLNQQFGKVYLKDKSGVLSGIVTMSLTSIINQLVQNKIDYSVDETKYYLRLHSFVTAESDL